MTKPNLKRIWKHGSTVLLITIVLILIVPRWRVSFQGWVQGFFMSDLEFETSFAYQIPPEVEKWSLKHANGEAFLFQDFLKKPIVLSFWATWCPPCRAELKELETLKTLYDPSIHFISVSEESIETIKKSGLNTDYDFLYSTERIPPFFNVSAYPTLCIIDKNGQLIFQHSGAGGLSHEKNKVFLNGLIENQ